MSNERDNEENEGTLKQRVSDGEIRVTCGVRKWRKERRGYLCDEIDNNPYYS